MTQQAVSTKTLIKSSIAASLVAALVFVCIILPVEYNIDPTHIGHTLGLTALANSANDNVLIKQQATIAEKEQHVIEIVVPADAGLEYKFRMNQHEKLTYEWITDGEPLYFDLHGEPEGDTTGYFESYAIATVVEMEGSFTSPFSGSHGWYWKNNSNAAVAIQLSVAGQFEVIGLKP